MHVLLRAGYRHLFRVRVVFGQPTPLVARDVLRVTGEPSRLLEWVTWQW
jgi:hypothetical protein